VEDNSWKPFRMRRNGLKISHLCFADDMLLFTEASMDQLERVTKCLDTFCAASGQKVSNTKTKVYFSKMYQSPWRVILAGEVVFKSLKIWGSI
jgi:hypothetical protein